MDQYDIKLINEAIAKVAKGDESALVFLYQKTGARLLSIARGVTGDMQLAEDAVQECFIKVVKYAGSFKESDNGYGWLAKIVRNESLTILKRFKPNHVDIDEFISLSDNKFSWAAVDENAALKAAVAKLSKDDRRLIWLKYVMDMTVRDIAAELKLPKSTVALKVKKAENALKKLLE